MPKSKKRTQSRALKARPVHYSMAANILAWLGVFFLVVNSIALIFMRNQVIQALGDAGISVTQSGLALLGLLWLLIAFFAWSINRTIKEKEGKAKVSMWELFVLAIVCILSGRIESGVLLLIASIIYLVKARKK